MWFGGRWKRGQPLSRVAIRLGMLDEKNRKNGKIDETVDGYEELADAESRGRVVHISSVNLGCSGVLRCKNWKMGKLFDQFCLINFYLIFSKNFQPPQIFWIFPPPPKFSSAPV